MNENDNLIYGIVGIIICIQLFFFLKNLKKIFAYKNTIARNENLSIIELNIDEDEVATVDPEYLIKNKSHYQDREQIDSEEYHLVETNIGESENINLNKEEVIEDYDDYNQDDEYYN